MLVDQRVGTGPRIHFFGRPTVSSSLPATLAVRFGADATPRYERAAPTLGEHNDEVLRDVLGLSDGEIAALRASGIIGQRPAGL